MRTEKYAKSRVLMIGPVAPPLGGMTISLNNLITSGLKDKYDISVLDITGYRARNKRGNILGGIAYQLYLMLKLVAILIVKRPRIVHAHMASFFYFFRRGADVVICKLFGKKVVFHLRGGKFIEFYNKSSFLGKSAIRSILRISDKVIVLSEYWKDFVSGIADKKKIMVVPNGVRCADFHLDKDKKIELGFTKDHILVLSMGPIGKRKGTFDVLASIKPVTARFNNISFIFCGTGEFEGEILQFLGLVRDMGFGPYAKYVENIVGQEKNDYYLSSDIFILPSYAENLPNSVLEAMAAGLPVIVSDVGAIPELVKDGVNGLIIKPGDVKAIADRIIMLAKDRDLRKRMGDINRELMRQKYDMPIIAGMIDRVYQELL